MKEIFDRVKTHLRQRQGKSVVEAHLREHNLNALRKGDKKLTASFVAIDDCNDSLNKKFMPAYDINNSDGSATLNWMKAALLPKWRETFFNKILPWRKNLERESMMNHKERSHLIKQVIDAAKSHAKCENLHHKKSHQHLDGWICPAESELEAAIYKVGLMLQKGEH